MFAVLPDARKVASRLFVLMSLLWLAACDGVAVPGASGGGSGQRIDTSAPIPVALLVPHGAANSGEAQLARDLENAARLAVADLQGVRIDLRVYGTAGQAANAQQAALKAAADGAKIILGPLHAESANAVAVAMAPRNVNVLAFSNNATIAGGNLFVLGNTFEDTADRVLGYARRNGKSKVLIVASDNLAGQVGQEAIAKAAARNGMSVAGRVGYQFSQQGVVAAVPRVVSTARSSGADTLMLTSNTAGALPLFAQMLPENGLGPDAIQWAGLTRWDQPPQTLSLPGLQGGWFTLPDTARATQFRNRFKATYGNDPHAIAGLAYDGIAAIGALARSGRSDALTRGSLTQSAGFQGTGGAFRLLPDGSNQRAMAIATIRNNQIVVLDPAPRSFGRGGF
ncbi:penicillin-binding protein activator [Roseovarius sp. SCSIO 43702]|uniref:penicillin-binding protein activator n=1 Tax=Roseovarius sp. SCSIO 43702 TaxID=2823043 RepID=UPI001C736B54|nr:penicillin-binding protein activator [Roseovarius sp. SCSIO 43702]QYX56499.1 penicillin-binding protein activator [Roseovarius sp. SCSIO 43702]